MTMPTDKMTDAEIGRECAEKMGYDIVSFVHNDSVCYPIVFTGNKKIGYDPLHDRAQAMDLVIKFHLYIYKNLRTDDDPFGKWFVSKGNYDAVNADLLRAICECVAKL